MAQENFGQMVDHVISFNQRIPTHIVKRRLNVHLRALQNYRTWGGLMVRGEIHCPNAYTTGTVACTPESDIVTGTTTAWPYNDKVNTTLSAAITAANELQSVTPVAMTNVRAGDWLLFDEGNAGEEWVLVHAITSTTFQARPTLTHSAGVTITRSSYSELQLRVGSNRNYYSIIGVKSDQTMKLDHVWSHEAETAATYQILKAYVTMPAGLKLVWSIVNAEQGWQMKAYIPEEVLQRFDTWRSSQGWPHLLVNFIPDHIGRIRYELYPAPTTEQGLPFLAARFISDLSDDEDCPPTCIPSHILVNFALADCLLHDRKSEYYDPTSSREFRKQAQDQLIDAVRDDDNIYLSNLQWSISQYNLIHPGSDWAQNHDDCYDAF